MNSKLLVLIVVIIAILLSSIAFLNKGAEKLNDKFDEIDDQTVIDTKG